MSSVVRGLLAGATVGTVLTVVAVLADPVDDAPVFDRLAAEVLVEPTPNDPADVVALAEAWRRWRSLPVHVTASYTRTVGGEQVLAGLDVLAQDPPQEVRSASGEVVALLDGERIVCSDAVDGSNQCASSGPFDRQGLVEAEVAGFTDALVGDVPDYHLRRHDGCFVLRRQQRLLAPPLRDVATYCFDDDGVLVLAEVRDAQATDRSEVVEVRPVTAADLSLPG